jgi:hypothetical protein
MIGVPALLVFIPPAVMFAPAAFAGFVQFAALVIGLATVAAVALDGFVEFMFGMRDMVSAFFLSLGVGTGNSRAE